MRLYCPATLPSGIADQKITVNLRGQTRLGYKVLRYHGAAPGMCGEETPPCSHSRFRKP